MKVSSRAFSSSTKETVPVKSHQPEWRKVVDQKHFARKEHISALANCETIPMGLGPQGPAAIKTNPMETSPKCANITILK